MNQILLSHGGGGEETQQLIRELFLKNFSNPILNNLEDAAVINIQSDLAFTTDSFTISPIFFNGGDIGKLSVCGTVNDLAVMGAKPRYLSLALIIEEGFDFLSLEKIVQSIKKETEKIGVFIVTGDTKVVPKKAADQIFINTSGIGEVIYKGLSSHHISNEDVILVSGTIGDHGACIMAQREGIEIETMLMSDCASLWPLVNDLILSNVRIKAMRDPTRGGLAAVLNEWAFQSQIGIKIDESSIPVKPEVRGICELLGLEFTHLACEGRLILAVHKEEAHKALDIMVKNPLGKGARIIGNVSNENRGRVILKSDYSTQKIMEPPAGELLPRIC